MRKNCFLALAVALLVPAAAWAQDAPQTTDAENQPVRTIPKVEFSFGGGAGIGGYLASFPGDPWLTPVGQSDDMLQDYMKFYLPKACLMPAGHAGLWLDFNFTEHWGFITGAELGLYFSRVSSENLLNVTTNVVQGMGREAYQRDIWIGSNLPDFKEQYRMFALQIPLMLKYMTPISPAGHQFYFAGGAKIGLPIISQYTQQWGEGQYDVFAETTVPADDLPIYLHTFNGGETQIVPHNDYGHLQDGTRIIKESAVRDMDQWVKVNANPIDVMASIDAGVRWNLGKGKGLYTGIYCDFGLLRPIARKEGFKVLNFASSQITYQPPTSPSGDDPLVSMNNSYKVAALAADAPDYAYFKEFQADGQDPVTEIVMRKNTDPLAASLHKMQAGIKVRFAFGRVGARVKKARVPKVKPVKPEQPTVVPDDIQQTMIRLSNALFAFDKFDLNEEARTMLDEVVGWLKEYPNLKVEIGGHTDNMGSDEYNQKLSENRAKSVYDYFVSHGVAADRLSYKGYGESRPIATNETAEGRQANRRVELQIKQ